MIAARDGTILTCFALVILFVSVALFLSIFISIMCGHLFFYSRGFSMIGQQNRPTLSFFFPSLFLIAHHPFIVCVLFVWSSCYAYYYSFFFRVRMSFSFSVIIFFSPLFCSVFLSSLLRFLSFFLLVIVFFRFRFIFPIFSFLTSLRKFHYVVKFFP